jgi:hypothetical protein
MRVTIRQNVRRAKAYGGFRCSSNRNRHKQGSILDIRCDLRLAGISEQTIVAHLWVAAASEFDPIRGNAALSAGKRHLAGANFRKELVLKLIVAGEASSATRHASVLSCYLPVLVSD